LPSAQTALEIPAWCGREITGDGRWSNAALARRPLQDWPLAEREAFGFA
jgi:adenylate cyclase